MAYTFHGNVTNTANALHDCLIKWSGWASIDNNVFHSLNDTDFVWDIYYSENGTYGSMGLAVPAYDTTASGARDNKCYIVRKDLEGNLTFHDFIIVNSSVITSMVVTNTVAYIGVRDSEMGDPHGIFATIVVDQANNTHTEVAVGYYTDTNCALYDSNQFNGDTSKIANVATVPIWHWDNYTMLIPLGGLDFGVASGIFFFMYSELPATSAFTKMVLNNKTFYVDDNIAIIDYFTGF